ncbi:MAG: alkaline phosphatase [Alphaproteobacteria bacterium]|nr:alkaline phosphatase [Alphaproteobacteria bacterium]
MQFLARAAVAAALALTVAAPAASGPMLERLGTFSAGTGAGGAEIPAYDPATRRAFIANGATGEVDVVSIANPYAPVKLGSLKPSVDTTGVGNPNSVAVKNGIVAVAVEGTVRQDPGKVAFYSAAGGFLGAVQVGALPDMVTFTPDGTKVLTANEGEPNSYNQASSLDPEGSVSIINIAGGIPSATVATAGFAAFNGQAAALRAAGVRIFGPNATVAQDLEPEYIAVSKDGATAWVTLQENNALAKIDIATATVTAITTLGAKDFNAPGNALDASDRDGPSNGPAINIRNWPVRGLYQPDAIAAFEHQGKTYLVTANEGDARDYTGFSEEARVGAASVVLDPTAFPNAATLKQNANLGRLIITNQEGKGGDGEFETLFTYGGRSVSIRDENGTLVWDSADFIERLTAAEFAAIFNSDGTVASFDGRSDNKGPEPEGVVVGEIGGSVYAFIGLERIGGVLVSDITDPFNPVFATYRNDNLPVDAFGHLGPEGLYFIAAQESPIGDALVLVANEVSGTTDIYRFTVAEPAALGVFALGVFALGGAGLLAPRRRRRA